ncbi:Hypothetical protein NTJ_04429 [Nesidiocoris tenuis]|uniref:DM10 domain-containing protein n=1 Tax=Nesidiocoris tenuis TaxID=355587 RepID=A0ABN7AL42_9HEMI|nr:Hypothetical protein NTJ_04429 [Nesidiocoris tenuis]
MFNNVNVLTKHCAAQNTEDHAAVSGEEKYAFKAEWFEPVSSMVRDFILIYFPNDNTLSLFDVKTQRTFLKRSLVENIDRQDIYVGNTVKIFSRHIAITGYANKFTENVVGRASQSICVIIKPDGRPYMGTILKIMLANGFKISEMRMLKLPSELVVKLFAHEMNSPDFKDFVEHMTSDPVVALELINQNAVDRMRTICGPEDPKIAKEDSPSSIRACFGTSSIQNVVHFSTADDETKLQCELLFGRSAPVANTATDTVLLKNSTLCIIKPHALRDGKAGEIIEMIEGEGYKITAIRMFRMNNTNAKEFLEVYRGVLPEYTEIVSEFVNGGLIAMEIVGPSKENTPSDFRTFAGPMDPDLAKKLRPNTLRARFGLDKVRNAIHATDLPDDAPLEVEYFFRIMVL